MIRACMMIFGLVFALTAGTGLNAGPTLALPATAAQRPSPDERDMVSWVVLSNTYSDFTQARLRTRLNEIFPGAFPLGAQNNFVMQGAAEGQFLIKSTIAGAAGLFLLISVPAPYTEFSDFADAIDDRALRVRAKAQNCWMSIDLIDAKASHEEAYRFIGRALANLAPIDTAVLVHPSRPVAMLFDETVRQRLASGIRP